MECAQELSVSVLQTYKLHGPQQKRQHFLTATIHMRVHCHYTVKVHVHLVYTHVSELEIMVEYCVQIVHNIV